ncbi:MAG: 3-deoxy-D-manno-octulosonic acid transferase [Bacteroidales bacterium]
MFIYDLVINLLPSGIKLLACFKEKEKNLALGQKNVFSYLKEHIDPNANYIWFHASSLGEFEQGRPMIEKIKREHPEYSIILTFFSPSGYEVRKNYPLADLICYLPFDTKKNVEQFLELVKPKKAIFIKYEFWLNYLKGLNERKIPTYIISAIFRPDQLFFKSHGSWYRKMLRYFDHIYLQDDNSKQLLSSIGYTNTTVCGDTRFDRVIEIQQQAKEIPLVELFSKDQKVMVAGSSWPKDEEVFVPYFNTNKEIKLIIAPHEIHEPHLKEIESRLKRPYLRFSQATPENIQSADCLIMDCFGMLSSVYRYGDVAYIGGGFGVGIHNILEAAVYGMPVIWGPNFAKFREAKGLISAGGGFSIQSSAEFNEKCDRLFSDKDYLSSISKKSFDFVADHSGATDKIYSDLF